MQQDDKRRDYTPNQGDNRQDQPEVERQGRTDEDRQSKRQKHQDRKEDRSQGGQ
ncbi:hypothetical protein L0244_02660 [bacterium]|nr:hypothetical protein [bacterium]